MTVGGHDDMVIETDIKEPQPCRYITCDFIVIQRGGEIAGGMVMAYDDRGGVGEQSLLDYQSGIDHGGRDASGEEAVDTEDAGTAVKEYDHEGFAVFDGILIKQFPFESGDGLRALYHGVSAIFKVGAV